MIKLYDNPLSGNCFKVKLLLVQSKIPFESVIIDVFKGESRKAQFLQINNAGKIPAIDDNGFILNESNAILLYLAEKYNKNLLSESLDERGKIYSWIFYNKTSVDPNLAKARAIKKFFPSDKQNSKELEFLQREGIKSLELIDKHLSRNDFFVNNYSVADIAMYPYIKLSYEGGIDIDIFKNITLWMNRVENTKEFINIY
ncbi:MAG: glutathione S-transferase family protein [Thermodesulfobacteriota bacterium]|jgi:glutathione S-transferase|nr:glutathione S-transferase family protein [Candidatus Dadabacteria bacterium]|tara:strand:- start:16922 stop:17521 length:600 start_codon:yes stop_codon:yes gene_type:complete